ncbi:hypothetical protein X474_16750 [Dethiosulfatarculus sandiegensis]|uniref:Uncharacterized protein n=1 Tax=Dethiosulfatarculus sandiegensis TaxID=1429043 RepID=A0A0D2JB58_9BACT|nr:hypothetical protein X474_16750 [Dethiosulfatarculus sandiegensis]
MPLLYSARREGRAQGVIRKPEDLPSVKKTTFSGEERILKVLPHHGGVSPWGDEESWVQSPQSVIRTGVFLCLAKGKYAG